MRSTLLPLCLFLAVVRSDDYVNEIEGRCYATQKAYSCTKYKLFKYIDEFKLEGYNLTSEVKLVDIPGANVSDSKVLQQARQYDKDSEIVKMMKFLKRKASKFLREQGVEVDLPEGAIVQSREAKGARGKKKKHFILLPFLILIKLFKVKVMVSMILAGVIFIKKAIIAAAFILPGVVAAIKAHCKAQQFHVVPYQVNEDVHGHDTHEHHDSGPGFDFSGLGSDKHYWDKKRRYSYLD